MNANHIIGGLILYGQHTQNQAIAQQTRILQQQQNLQYQLLLREQEERLFQENLRKNAFNIRNESQAVIEGSYHNPHLLLRSLYYIALKGNAAHLDVNYASALVDKQFIHDFWKELNHYYNDAYSKIGQADAEQLMFIANLRFRGCEEAVVCAKVYKDIIEAFRATEC
jgi:hypothetical protein